MTILLGPLAAIRLTAFGAVSMQQNCHPDRSVPGFPATRHSPASTCAAFSKESRMKFANATNLDGKSGAVGEGPAVGFRRLEPAASRSLVRLCVGPEPVAPRSHA